MRAVEERRVQRGRRRRPSAVAPDGLLARAVVEGVEVVEARAGVLGRREGDVAGGGGQGRHVAERRGVVQHGGPAEGRGLAAGGAPEAGDRRDVEPVGAVAVGGPLGRDLDLLPGRRARPDRAVDPDLHAWQEVAVVGEGAGGAGVAEHGAGHREVGVGPLAPAGKKQQSGDQQNLQRKKQHWFLHGSLELRAEKKLS